MGMFYEERLSPEDCKQKRFGKQLIEKIEICLRKDFIGLPDILNEEYLAACKQFPDRKNIYEILAARKGFNSDIIFSVRPIRPISPYKAYFRKFLEHFLIIFLQNIQAFDILYERDLLNQQRSIIRNTIETICWLTIVLKDFKENYKKDQSSDYLYKNIYNNFLSPESTKVKKDKSYFVKILQRDEIKKGNINNVAFELLKKYFSKEEPYCGFADNLGELFGEFSSYVHPEFNFQSVSESQQIAEVRRDLLPVYPIRFSSADTICTLFNITLLGMRVVCEFRNLVGEIKNDLDKTDLLAKLLTYHKEFTELFNSSTNK